MPNSAGRKGAREGGSRAGNTRGRNATSAPAHVAAADTFSLIRLRQRRARLWLTAAGVASLASIYVGPLAIALRTAATGPVTTVSPLPTLRVPYVSFAQLAVPKLHAAPVVAPAAPALHVGNKHIRTRIPVVSDSYSLAPSSIAPTTTPVDLFASTPVVTDTAGAPVSIASTPAPAAATPPASAAPAAPDAQQQAPAAPSRSLQSAQGNSDGTTPQDPPAAPGSDGSSQQTISSGGSGTISTGSGAAIDSGPAPQLDPTDTTVSVPDPSSPSLQVNTPDTTTIDTNGVTGAASTPPQVSGTSPSVGATSGDPASQSQDGSSPVAGTGSGSGGGAGTSNGQTGASGGSTTTPAPAGSDGTDSTGVTTPPPDPAATPGSGPSPPAAWNVSLSDASHTVSIAVTADALVVTVDGVASSRPVAAVTSLTVTGGAGDDSFDVSAGALPVPVALNGGAGTDTLHGPAADSTWTISGEGSGSVAGISFAGFENLAGAAGNKDTFVVEPGAGVSGVIDGGPGGFDTVQVSGARVVSNPTDPHSGTLIVDGRTIMYAGLEPVTISSPTVVINGADSSLDLNKDLMKVAPGAAGTITVTDEDPILHSSLGESQSFTISGATDVTINGGKGVDTVEFTGDYLVPNSNLTVNAETIKVDAGKTINVGTGNITLHATLKDNAISKIGLTSTGLPDDATIDINGATLVGNTIDLAAFSGTLTTTVSGAGQTLPGGTLNVASTDGFDSSGTFTVDGVTGTCAYTGTTDTSFNTITGCTGTPADGATVETDIDQTGNSAGINYAAVQLIYDASVNIHGASTVTATGDVTLSSTVSVTATASAAGGPDKGNWTSGIAYNKGDVVTDTTDGNRYDAKDNIAAVDNTAAPSTDSTHWEKADSKDSSVAATVLVANAKSQLSDTSSISATNGNVKISSSMTSTITTVADSSAAGSGAGIAVGVVVTDSEAFIDSTNAAPVTSKGLSVTADTNDNTPTTGKSSPKGSKGNDTGSNDPTGNPANGSSTAQKDAAGGKADGQSKTSDGNQNLSAALAVTVLVATTQAYIAPSSGSTSIDVGTGTILVHAGSSAGSSAIADAGNVKFSPDAPTLAASVGGSLADSTTYYYTVTATFAGGSTTATGSQTLSGTADTLNVTSTSGFGPSGKLTVAGLTGTCAYTGTSGGTQFTGVSGCTGSLTGGEAVTEVRESMPSPESKLEIASGATNKTIGLTWGAVANATGYRVYRATTSGSETFLAPAAGTSYNDDGTVTPSTTDKAPTADPNSGIGIAVAVNVVVLTTKAYLDGNLNLVANTVTVETVAPGTATTTVSGALQSLAGGTLVVAATTGFASAGTFQVAGITGVCSYTSTDATHFLGITGCTGTPNDTATVTAGSSTFTAHATSGAGGSSVGVAGSIAVNVVTSNTTSNAGTTSPVTVNGDVSLTSRTNHTNNAIADAKQASDGSTSGVGASFALNVINETTSAGLANGATLTGAKSLTLTSNDTDTTTTTADGGASAGSGSIALSAQVAISLSNVTTSATIGTGPDLSVGGAVTAHATQTAKVTTTATGATKGGNAGIGLSLALTVANHLVDSQLERNLAATGAVSFTADGSSSTDSEATASAKGAKGKGDDTSGKDVNGKADSNLSDANSTSSGASGKDSGKTNTPAAKSGDDSSGSGGSSVEVAAAAAITMITSQSLAQIADGLTVTSGGLVTLSTSANTDGTAKGSGSAVDASSLNIGAAVAITLATVTNAAVVGTDATVNSHGLTLAAAMRNNAGDTKHSFDAEATSGAGKGKVGIAGSFALTIANVTTNAELKSNGARAPPNMNSSDVTLSAASSVSSTDKAMANDKDAGTVGIGAGAALNIVFDTTTASIDDGAALTGAKNVTLSATDTDATTTYAEAGATGASGSDLVLTADAAIALPTVLTSATIAGGASQTLTTSGAVSVSATQTATATTTAKGDATGGDVAIGLALALAIPDDEVTATDSRTISATKVSFSANGSSDTETEADASATGAKGQDSGTKKDSSGKDVNGKADDQLSNANSESSANTGKTSKTSDTSGAKAQTSDSNGTSSGDSNTVTVAGAVAINIVTTISRASLADTAVVTATERRRQPEDAGEHGRDREGERQGRRGRHGRHRGRRLRQQRPHHEHRDDRQRDGLVERPRRRSRDAGARHRPHPAVRRERVEDDRVRRGVPGGSRGRRLLPADAGRARDDGRRRGEPEPRRHREQPEGQVDRPVRHAGRDRNLDDRGDHRHLLVLGDRRDELQRHGLRRNAGGQGDRDDEHEHEGRRRPEPARGDDDRRRPGSERRDAEGRLARRLRPERPVHRRRDQRHLLLHGHVGREHVHGRHGLHRVAEERHRGHPRRRDVLADGSVDHRLRSVERLLHRLRDHRHLHVHRHLGRQHVHRDHGLQRDAEGQRLDHARRIRAGHLQVGRHHEAVALPDRRHPDGDGLPDQPRDRRLLPADEGSVHDGQGRGPGSLVHDDAERRVDLRLPADERHVHRRRHHRHLHYTGTTTTSFTGVTGCTGIPADGAAITAGTAAGIYKWNGSAWTFVGDGTALPETATSGDLFRLAEHDVAAEARVRRGRRHEHALARRLRRDQHRLEPHRGDRPGRRDRERGHRRRHPEDAEQRGGHRQGRLRREERQGRHRRLRLRPGAERLHRPVRDRGRRHLLGRRRADDLGRLAPHGRDRGQGRLRGRHAGAQPVGVDRDRHRQRLGPSRHRRGADRHRRRLDHRDRGSRLEPRLERRGRRQQRRHRRRRRDQRDRDEHDRRPGARPDRRVADHRRDDDADDRREVGVELEGRVGLRQERRQAVQRPGRTTRTRRARPTARCRRRPTRPARAAASRAARAATATAAASTSRPPSPSTGRAARTSPRSRPNITVVATGAVKVDAEDQTGANSRAIGFSGNLQSDVAIGAGVGLNVEDITNTASIGAGAHVTGGGVTVQAVTPSGKEDDFIVWGIAAAGGKSDASIAASVGVQVLTFHTTASIGAGAHVTSTDVVDVEASQNIGLQNLAIAAALSTSGTAVGGAFVVNILPAVQTQAFIDAGAVVDAAKALTVKATSSINPIVPDPKITKITLPAVSSIAVAGGAGGGDAAVTGSVIVDVFSITTQAWIADNAQINQSGPLGTSAQTIDVSATDTTHLINVAGALALSEGSAAVGVSIIVDVIDKDVGAWIGKTAHVSSGGDMSVSASSTENLFELAVAGGASEGAAVTGSILVVVLNEAGTHSTTAFIDNGAVVHAGGKVAVSASDSADLTLSSGNVAIGGGSAGVGASVVVLVRNGTVDAAIHQNAHVDADGGNGVSVSATQSVNGIYIAVGGAGGDSVGVAGSVVVDVMSDSTKAHVDGGVVIGDAPERRPPRLGDGHDVDPQHRRRDRHRRHRRCRRGRRRRGREQGHRGVARRNRQRDAERRRHGGRDVERVADVDRRRRRLRRHRGRERQRRRPGLLRHDRRVHRRRRDRDGGRQRPRLGHRVARDERDRRQHLGGRHRGRRRRRGDPDRHEGDARVHRRRRTRHRRRGRPG